LRRQALPSLQLAAQRSRTRHSPLKRHPLEPVGHCGDEAQVLADVPLADPPDGDGPAVGVRDGAPEDALGLEDPGFVVPYGPVALVGEDLLCLLEPDVYGQVVLRDAALLPRRANHVVIWRCHPAPSRGRPTSLGTA
jgi:hypothetical protein